MNDNKPTLRKTEYSKIKTIEVATFEEASFIAKVLVDNDYSVALFKEDEDIFVIQYDYRNLEIADNVLTWIVNE